MRDWKFVQTGNALRVSSIDSHAENPNSEIAKELYDAYIKAGKDRNKALANLIKEMPNADKRMLENGLDKAINAFEKRTLNETPLKLGDTVEVSGKKGKVTKIVSSDVVEVFFDNSGTYYPDRTDRYYTSEVKKVGNMKQGPTYWIFGLDEYKKIQELERQYEGTYVNSKGEHFKVRVETRPDMGGYRVTLVTTNIDKNAPASMSSKLPSDFKKVGNESIDKQEWSMFHGLKKDAEKEVGNAYTPNPELIKILESWLHNRISEQEARAKIMKITGDKNITDMMIHSPGGFIPTGNKKTGNKTIMDDGGRFIWGYVEKENDGFSAYTHGITGAKDYLLKAKDEATAIKELKDYCRTYWKKQGNSRMCNETAEERKFGKVMGEFKEGELKTPQGKTVTDPEQAKAIAYIESKNVNNLQRARNAMKIGNLDHVDEGDYVDVRINGELVEGVVRKIQGTQALVTVNGTDQWFPIRSLKEPQ